MSVRSLVDKRRPPQIDHIVFHEALVETLFKMQPSSNQVPGPGIRIFLESKEVVEWIHPASCSLLPVPTVASPEPPAINSVSVQSCVNVSFSCNPFFSLGHKIVSVRIQQPSYSCWALAYHLYLHLQSHAFFSSHYS